MVSAQQGGDFVSSLVSHLLAQRRAEDAAQVGLCQQALHHRGVRGQHHVILVHTHAVVAFAFQHANHAEGHLVEAYYLADRVAVGKEVIHDGLADDAHLGRGFDVRFGEDFAALYRELAYLQVVVADACYARGVVVVAGNELTATGYVGAHRSQVACLVAEGLVVGYLQRLHGAGILAHASHHVGSGVNHNHVRAHLRDLGLYALLRPLSDGQHGDDRSHTNDDTEHG